MKALAYYHPHLAGSNATFFDHAALRAHGIAFEGKSLIQMGVVGPDATAKTLFHCLQRSGGMDAARLLRIATYELPETRWGAFFVVDDLEGVFYLSRIPGAPASLQFLPFREKAIVITHRALGPHEVDAPTAHDGLATYSDHYRRLKKKAA